MMHLVALAFAFATALDGDGRDGRDGLDGLDAGGLDADPRYVEAVRAYEELELDPALASFRALSVDPAFGEKDRARLLVWIGLTRAQRSELDEAAKAFDAALVLDRAVRLPVRTSPKVAVLFEDARARMPETSRGVDKPPAERMPPDKKPPDDTPPPDAELPVPAIVAGSIGAVALIGAGVAGVLTSVHYSGAVNSLTPQPEAKALVDLANAELMTAIVLGGAAVVLGGAALILLDANGNATDSGDGT